MDQEWNPDVRGRQNSITCNRMFAVRTQDGNKNLYDANCAENQGGLKKKVNKNIEEAGIGGQLSNKRPPRVE